eukprot:jgi/Bigna1/141662/aug1.64_g16370
MGLEEAIRMVFDDANALGLFDLELLNARLSLDLVDSLPQLASSTLQECRDLDINIGLDPMDRSSLSSRYSYSFSRFGQFLFDQYSFVVQRALQQVDVSNGQNSAIVTQTVNSLTNNTNQNLTSGDLNMLSDIMSTTVNSTSSIDIVDSGVGQDIGSTLTRLVDIGFRNINNNNNDQQEEDEGITM